jgi:hypothetical protein
LSYCPYTRHSLTPCSRGSPFVLYSRENRCLQTSNKCSPSNAIAIIKRLVNNFTCSLQVSSNEQEKLPYIKIPERNTSTYFLCYKVQRGFPWNRVSMSASCMDNMTVTGRTFVRGLQTTKRHSIQWSIQGLYKILLISSYYVMYIAEYCNVILN